MKNKVWQVLLGIVFVLGTVGGTATAMALNGAESGAGEYPCSGPSQP